jgi:hypothetical protein
MKKSLLVFLVLLVFGFTATSWGQCPEDANDYGECDTLHIIPWDADIQTLKAAAGGPYRVRVLIRATCDVVDELDSIRSFVIPLCFTHSREELSCELPSDSNNTFLYPFPVDQSIFRHMGTAPEDSNWMMQLSEDFMSKRAWDTVILDLEALSHFWLTMFPTGSEDQSFISGSRILLATMDFLLEDTMTVCIDTCFWPPAEALKFCIIREAKCKIPRSEYDTGLFKICFPEGAGDVKEIESADESKPSEFSLSQNYPNPFNPVTNFRFTLAKASHVRIEIYNIVGQRVKTLVDEEMKPGVYLADWDSKDDKGNSVSSGIYFYRMTASDFSDMKKMVLVK